MAEPILPEMQDITRQRDLAKMLLQKGMTDNLQGQMVSGRYVGASPLQGIANVYSAYKGRQLANEADRKQIELAKALREEGVRDIGQYMSALQGKPESVTYSAEEVGPSMNVTPATGPDYNKALSIALGSRSPMVQALGAQTIGEMTKPQKLGEGEQFVRFNPTSGKYETIASGAEKFRAPLQVDTGTSIQFLDPKDPTKVLQTIPKSQAGQVVEREDGTYLVDTRTGASKPVVGPQGQPLTGGKPLTDEQGKSVGFGARAIESNRIATDLENKGFRNTGAIRTALGGFVGMTPFVGEQLEQGVRSTFNVLPSITGGTNAEQQQVEQARRNFVSAVLRKESGAAIGVDEYKNEERKYFPQAGDTDKVIKQKQEARRLAIKALEAQAGPSGARQINRILNQPQGGGGDVVDFNQLPTGR